MSIQIFVQDFNDRKTVFDVDLNDQVSDLKEKVQCKLGYVPAQQSLTYRGKVLQDNRTLRDYGIQRDAVVSLIGRVRGGEYSATRGPAANLGHSRVAN
jgi:hypothetical protein